MENKSSNLPHKTSQQSLFFTRGIENDLTPFLSKNGKKEFVVLPYEEFVRIEELLAEKLSSQKVNGQQLH